MNLLKTFLNFVASSTGCRARACLLVLAVFAAVSAYASPKPPIPNGARALVPGQLPKKCSESDAPFNESGATYGYYWSAKSRNWVQAPFCYARWGYIEASAPQLIAAGDTVTVAVNFDDARITALAPLRGVMHWDYPGSLVSGCGSSDLTCTVKLGSSSHPSKEWQWAEFHVSAPGRYLVLPPSYNRCSEAEPCLDTMTNAWAYVGIDPGACSSARQVFANSTGATGQIALARKVCKPKRTISGKVTASTGEPLSRWQVVAQLGKRRYSTNTDLNGAFTFAVRQRGSYEVSVIPRAQYLLKQASCAASPCHKRVSVKNRPVENVNFKTSPIQVRWALRDWDEYQTTSNGSFFDPQGLIATSRTAANNTLIRFTYRGESLVLRIVDHSVAKRVKTAGGSVVRPAPEIQLNISKIVFDVLGASFGLSNLPPKFSAEIIQSGDF